MVSWLCQTCLLFLLWVASSAADAIHRGTGVDPALWSARRHWHSVLLHTIRYAEQKIKNRIESWLCKNKPSVPNKRHGWCCNRSSVMYCTFHSVHTTCRPPAERFGKAIRGHSSCHERWEHLRKKTNLNYLTLIIRASQREWLSF